MLKARVTSGAGSFHKADDFAASPARDTFAGGVIVPVQNATFRDIDPIVWRVLPACELAADERLKMTIHNTILHHAAV